MGGPWRPLRLLGTLAIVAVAATPVMSGLQQEEWHGVLDEHPSIQYASRPTTDRVAKLNGELAAGRTLARESGVGYLRSVLAALRIPAESQLLVFSKTGVQRAYTSPLNPRALFFDQSVAVGYVAGAPVIEVAAHDAQQGVVFYTLDQAAPAPRFVRRTSCLTCHVSASTLDVPGVIARSNTVGDDGTPLPQTASENVDHRTPHPDRWGGWYVTSEGGPAPYSQRAHMGNIAFSGQGVTSSQVFVDWLNSSPETRGYLSESSDAVPLLVFDHQMHAINLLTRLNWEARIGAPIQRLIDELADYLLFTGEFPLPTALTPNRAYAGYLAARAPKDRRGRSFGELDLNTRLLRYPCSFMVYSEAFDGLPPGVRQAVYRRMLERLSGSAVAGAKGPSADDRRAVLEILRDTKPDFPR